MPGIADATPSGRCRLDAIARWLQDAAYEDVLEAGFDGRGVWILRRARIRVESFPRFGDRLSVRTFCTGIGRFSAERTTSIESQSATVDAVGIWVYLDPETGRPLRFEPEFLEIYQESAQGRNANVRLRHPDPPDGAKRSSWTFRASEMDPAGHINNSHYWTLLEEQLAQGSEPTSLDAEVEYRDPAMPGEVELIRDGSSLWIASDGAIHASVIRA
jgi:acyl-ACP thioesterase